ncbi:MAG: cbb3-type cytochrome oxidase assembly protein CcoS, partial [Spiribacter salinus]
MSLTIGMMMALSFVASLVALAFLIWAVAARQFQVTQADAEAIFDETDGAEHPPDDPTSFGFRADGADKSAMTGRVLILTLVGFATVWLVVGSAFGLIASL